MERDPAGIAAHHFDDHDPAMRFGRGVQSIDRIGREVDCGIEPEQLVVPTMSLSIVFGTHTSGMPIL